jgi:hypothetical protein
MPVESGELHGCNVVQIHARDSPRGKYSLSRGERRSQVIERASVHRRAGDTMYQCRSLDHHKHK